MRLLAIDPGKRIGFCFGEFDQGRITILEMGTLDMWEGLADLFARAKPTKVILERYFRADPSLDLVVAEVSGTIKFLAFMWDAEVIMQEPFIPKYIKTRYFDSVTPNIGDNDIHAEEALYHLIHGFAGQEVLVAPLVAEIQLEGVLQ